MKKEEIHLEDIWRILFGQAPPIFLLEVVFRTVITYVLLLFIVSWLGKRMSGQLTIMEMAVLLTLGAIVSVPMQTPDRGILQGLILLLCAVGFQRGISLIGFNNHKIENITQGKPTTLVKDGVMDLEKMANERISRQQIFAQLRGQNIFNLGMVDRVYLEAAGMLSIYTASKPRPGLPLYPPDDSPFYNGELLATENTEGIKVCVSCGKVLKSTEAGRCPNCEHDEFTHAVC
ncbi:DUF421 domain-containing protein [Mucilaginibacter limnophilus]|uniref:DUF421 domain-containing protein n=1 Tax=Mucilaginibacter limnophilus TaxID=1932778 RepID=A0A437MRQ9_9SPHI|nr:YetF domain-containing protein [Mucilaginibacter limnophilus]RVU00313.1 DUF421 domain-containing protein [Mucilaginibacter limnophilus]